MLTMSEMVRSGLYRTDKEFYNHCYGNQFYDHEFRNLRDKPISLLEIGVQYGGSLKLWHDYFPQAERLVGIDITMSLLDPELRSWSRIEFIEEDAYYPPFVATLGQFDIIIDDGPHDIDLQLDFLRLYIPHLKPNGILVIEDVALESNLELLRESLTPEWRAKSSTYDFRHVKGQFDDMLFVIRN